MVIWRRRGRPIVLRVGRRGASLLFLGLLDIAICVSLIPSISPEVRVSPLYKSFGEVAPLPFWATCWGVVSVTCLIFAFKPQDRIAFTMASAIKATWAMLSLNAWITDDVPRAWVGAAVWGAFGAWVLVISTWPEVLAFRAAPPDTNGDAVVVANQDGIVTSWNDRATKIFGWTPSEIIGHGVQRIIPDRFQEDHHLALQGVRATGHSDLAGRAIKRLGVHKDGHEIPVEVVISVLATQIGYTFTAVIRPDKQGAT